MLLPVTAVADLPAWTDRVSGCLLGGALGDAVGAPFEGSPPVPAGAVHDLLATRGRLTWTDDTAMMLTLAEHLAGLPSWQAFDEGALAVAHARAWQAEPWRGYGASPPAIFRAVLAGEDWEAVAAGLFGGSGSLGNGAAMRAAPLGALPVPAEAVARLARRAARITHTHEEGTDGAVAIAVATWRCLREPAGTAARPATAGTGPAWAAALLADVADQLRWPRMQQAVQAVADTVRLDDPLDVAAVTGTGITALEAVPAALAAFLHHPTDPVAAITFAVRMGGDTDTVATMAGALAGARAGAAVLPDDLVNRLEGADQIHGVATTLARAMV